nr:tRNA pseudouridine(55) synthase TruB [uncultured Oscillibacter sp.]
MPNGIIIIDKPAGWTSMDVCAKLRGVFHEKRIGHGGTLDPMANGLLPVFVGRATRAVEFADRFDKQYIAEIKLGVVTNTQDSTGEVLETCPVHVSREQLEAALEKFRGDILQVPPMYSAIKIKGKKLYELARRGQEVERPPRPVTIYGLEVLDQKPWKDADYMLWVHCSKGTYIRTLCHDIGQHLGCGACMADLRRSAWGGFDGEDAWPLERVLEMEHPEELLMPVDALFRDREKLVLSPAAERKVRSGAAAALPGAAPGEYRVYAKSGEFLALCRVQDGRLSTIKSFFEV